MDRCSSKYATVDAQKNTAAPLKWQKKSVCRKFHIIVYEIFEKKYCNFNMFTQKWKLSSFYFTFQTYISKDILKKVGIVPGRHLFTCIGWFSVQWK